MSSEETSPSAVMGPVAARPYWVVLLSVVIRALHQVGAGVYLASFLVDGIAGPPTFYLWLSVVTGLGLTATEGLRHRALYREVAGLATILKVVLLGIAFHGYLPEAGTVTLAFLVAAIAAHLPKNLRHRLVF
ncbi:MAG: hypothetical protein P8X86_01395 [Desulfofustis sp.]|jgi:hypothetical protein